ncbi:unnamed protein product, partial [Laminaria digitata]
KVAACVRTKDAGRFLPEWIAYHHAIGVDELTIYDDDSVDDTKQVKRALPLLADSTSYRRICYVSFC